MLNAAAYYQLNLVAPAPHEMRFLPTKVGRHLCHARELGGCLGGDPEWRIETRSILKLSYLSAVHDVRTVAESVTR